MDRETQLMLVELNEVDPRFLRSMGEKLGLPNLLKVLALCHAETTTQDETEHQGLDPWVQWVGVHCGRPTAVHGVRRLGSTRGQALPQIWHAIADLGFTWGAFGVMNAPMGNSRGCRFFMPDPWSFDETAFPSDLNDLLALPRYVAKNYLEIDYRQAFKAALRLARFFAPPKHWALLARFGARCLRSVYHTGPNVHTFTTLLDYLSVLCFVRMRQTFRPNLSIIFLNHIAHLQHQFWLKGDELHPEMRLALELCEAMIGLLLTDRQEAEAFIMMNGLRQKNVAGEGFHVYRQRMPQLAIEAMGIVGGRVEQCMTHDANIVFADPADADRAFAILDQCYLSDGHRAFFVERQSAERLFYQLAFEHRIELEIAIVSGNYSEPFYNVFDLICERTGAHVPQGDIFFDGLHINDGIFNHQVFDAILKYFVEGSRRSERVDTPRVVIQ